MRKKNHYCGAGRDTKREKKNFSICATAIVRYQTINKWNYFHFPSTSTIYDYFLYFGEKEKSVLLQNVNKYQINNYLLPLCGDGAMEVEGAREMERVKWKETFV